MDISKFSDAFPLCVVLDSKYPTEALIWLRENVEDYLDCEIPTTIDLTGLSLDIRITREQIQKPFSCGTPSKTHHTWLLTYFLNRENNYFEEVVYVVYFKNPNNALKFKLMGF